MRSPAPPPGAIDERVFKSSTYFDCSQCGWKERERGGVRLEACVRAATARARSRSRSRLLLSSQRYVNEARRASDGPASDPVGQAAAAVDAEPPDVAESFGRDLDRRLLP